MKDQSIEQDISPINDILQIQRIKTPEPVLSDHSEGVQGGPKSTGWFEDTPDLSKCA
jgi:hypothetical protein